MALELAPLCIRVTVVEPGGFRTTFLGNSMTVSPRTIDADAPLREQLLLQPESRNGAQLGNPALGAAAIIKAVTSKKPPRHLLLGSDACQSTMKQLEVFKKEFEAWRELTFSTDIRTANVPSAVLKR